MKIGVTSGLIDWVVTHDGDCFKSHMLSFPFEKNEMNLLAMSSNERRCFAVLYGFAAADIYSVTSMLPPWPLVISDVLDIMDVWVLTPPPFPSPL